ncbi:glutamate 5-kinase [Thiovulum sp. ES]|nr:glutamate 5-kinase [Thiovulum sp. ES]
MKKRIVIKVGSAVLSQGDEIAKDRIINLVSLIAKIKEAGIDVILVTSGAVSAGYKKVPLDKSLLKNRQALASIGQLYLMSIYYKKFRIFGINIAQILLVESDFVSKKRRKNARNNIEVLLENGIVPIINENDAVAIDELVFGDNDSLSAHTANLSDANLLVLLSDIDGYYDKNPKIYSDAKIKKYVDKISDSELVQTASPNNEFATGGIVTKLKSAKILEKYGIPTFLTSGFDLNHVENFILNGVFEKGTLFFGRK